MDKEITLHRILIIDDNSDYRKLLLKWLGSEFQGVEIVEYDPQDQGIPGADFDWPAYDVLLLDYELSLNNATGLDIIKANHDNVLFPATIMLTGAGSEDVAVRAFKSGITDYLRKEWLDREKLKVAVDNAFSHQVSKRQRLSTLEEAIQIAQVESKKVIATFKSKYAKLRELEVKRVKAEREKIEQELQKKQELLRQIEQERQKAEQAKQNLIAEMNKLKATHATATEDTALSKQLETTQYKLDQTDAGIRRIEHDYSQTKVAVARSQWKQDQGIVIQQQMENDTASFKEELKQYEKQMSDFNVKIKDRLSILESIARRKKESAKIHDKILLDDITSKLDKEDK